MLTEISLLVRLTWIFCSPLRQNNHERWNPCIEIHSDNYKIAALSGQAEAVEIIRRAENALSQLTGNHSVTLIAYEKNDGDDSIE